MIYEYISLGYNQRDPTNFCLRYFSLIQFLKYAFSKFLVEFTHKVLILLCIVTGLIYSGLTFPSLLTNLAKLYNRSYWNHSSYRICLTTIHSGSYSPGILVFYYPSKCIKLS